MAEATGREKEEAEVVEQERGEAASVSARRSPKRTAPQELKGHYIGLVPPCPGALGTLYLVTQGLAGLE